MPARTVYLIKRIETEVTSRMNNALSDYGITLAQFIVLNFVNDNQFINQILLCYYHLY